MDKVQDIHHIGGDPADRIELVVNSFNSRVYGACSITYGPGDSINIGPAWILVTYYEECTRVKRDETSHSICQMT